MNRWMIFENRVPEKRGVEGFNWISVTGPIELAVKTGDPGPPQFNSREEVDTFIAELQIARDRVYPPECSLCGEPLRADGSCLNALAHVMARRDD